MSRDTNLLFIRRAFIFFLLKQSVVLVMSVEDPRCSSTNRKDKISAQRCCNSTGPDFAYLSTYLEALRVRNCSKFVEECQKQTYALTEFTLLVYLRFCNRTEMITKCHDYLRTIVGSKDEESLSAWNNLTQSLEILIINNEDLANPCLQVALLDKASAANGHFYEIIAAVPFYEVVWCGFSEDLLKAKHVSVWNCIPKR